MGKINREEYKVWKEAELTIRQARLSAEFAKELEHSQEDMSEVSAARAHWMRKGAELLWTFVFDRVPASVLNKDEISDIEAMNFGADKIMEEDVVVKNKE